VSVADELVFDWDEANVAHVARHKITPEDVAEVFANDPMDLSAEVVDGEQRYTGVGHTNRLRVLVLVWTMRGDASRPITAFDASEGWQSVTWRKGDCDYGTEGWTDGGAEVQDGSGRGAVVVRQPREG
jgi:uncharacterized DUF497 family protein